MAKNKPTPFDDLKLTDIGESFGDHHDIFGHRLQIQPNLIAAIATMNIDDMLDDSLAGKTEHKARVLKVLSGPQARNEASTSGGNLRKSVNINTFRPPEINDKKNAKVSKPVSVIAHVEGITDDLVPPEAVDGTDEMRLTVYPEFVQFSSEPWHEEIVVGSHITVKLFNKDNPSGYDGRPSGIISSLIAGPSVKIETDPPTPPKERFESPCRGKRQLTEPALQLYHGSTVANPNVFPGPPIKKIKNKIKTGMFGNGTPQTKAHFDEALKASEQSFKHKIPGPAPNSDNAFVWIGHLKNNGYMDLVDRPISPGRETIIYAPMTLDLSSPIEIKYYFHDMGGFGHSWINGPPQTVAHAIENVVMPTNDFRTKIAPSIKDLIKDGRNFILVIPEMMYSRGFGTARNDSRRVDAIAKGKGIDEQGAGPELAGESMRTNMWPDARAAVKRYLKSLPLGSKANQTLLKESHLVDRQFKTFDGSLTGGDFGSFHQEVIETIEEQIGTIYEKLTFITIIADGLGTLALAALCQFVPTDEQRIKATQSFRSVQINRIDFIDTGIDNKFYYTFVRTPSHTLYNDYLLYRAGQGQHIEMNYITEYSDRSAKTNALFESAGAGSQYTNNYKSTAELGERRFSFFIDNNPTSKAFVSMHVAKKATTKKRNKVGYAFSMINDFIGTSESLLLRGDSIKKTPHDAVPDHADACTAMPDASSILDAVQFKLSTLSEKIKWFESVLLEIINSNDFGSSVCKNPEYSIFCEPYYDAELLAAVDVFVHDEGSPFWTSYLEYLENKKSYWDVKLKGEHESVIEKIVNNKKALIAYRDNVAQVQLDILTPAYENWLNYYSSLKLPETTYGVGGLDLNILTHELVDSNNIEYGLISEAAREIAEKEVLEKLIPEINKAIKKTKPPPTGQPEQCEPQPLKLGKLRRPKPPGIPEASTSPLIICEEKEISVVDNVRDLIKIIPYFPKKTDFEFSGRKSLSKVNIENQNIGYKIKKFKYKARRASGTTYLESPPIWSCLSDHLQVAWQDACTESGYTPFSILHGIQGSFGKPGTTAYRKGLSTHSLGLAIDVDPFIAGNSGQGKPVYSVFTGAWTASIIEEHGKDLYDLGVYRTPHEKFLDNAYEDKKKKILRKAENWSGAFNAYKKDKEKYNSTMSEAKGLILVPKNANPLKWVVLFCEKSGMRWGNAWFLKKRWRGEDRTWTEAEQKDISDMLGVKNVVKRIQAISWKNNEIDDHMHFQYWSGGSIIPWQEKTE